MVLWRSLVSRFEGTEMAGDQRKQSNDGCHRVLNGFRTFVGFFLTSCVSEEEKCDDRWFRLFILSLAVAGVVGIMTFRLKIPASEATITRVEGFCGFCGWIRLRGFCGKTLWKDSCVFGGWTTWLLWKETLWKESRTLVFSVEGILHLHVACFPWKNFMSSVECFAKSDFMKTEL